MKIAKGIMKKAKSNGDDVWMAVQLWRNTYTERFSSSPVQRLFGRRTNVGTLLVDRGLLMPRISEKATEELRKTKEKQKKYYNQHAHDLTELRYGDKVCTEINPGSSASTWIRGTII